MIARVWKGETKASDADAYTEVLERTGRAEALSTRGNRGVQILRHAGAERATFVFISFWDSMDAVRAFAGDAPERARYFDEDERYLLGFPETVEHYDVVD